MLISFHSAGFLVCRFFYLVIVGLDPTIELFGALGFHFAHLTGGCLISHDFYNKYELHTAYGSANDSGSYNFGSFRPYVGIGFSFTEIFK